MTRVCLFACAIAAAGPPAAAQTLVGATAGASTQGEGASDLPYLGPPFGGTSAAILVSVDRAPARNIALGGEVSLAGATSGAQSQRAPGGSNTFVSEHRDTVVSGTLKIGTPFDAPVRLALWSAAASPSGARSAPARSIPTSGCARRRCSPRR